MGVGRRSESCDWEFERIAQLLPLLFTLRANLPTEGLFPDGSRTRAGDPAGPVLDDLRLKITISVLTELIVERGRQRRSS